MYYKNNLFVQLWKWCILEMCHSTSSQNTISKVKSYIGALYNEKQLNIQNMDSLKRVYGGHLSSSSPLQLQFWFRNKKYEN